MKLDDAALVLNSDCYCWPMERTNIVETILAQNAAPDMAERLDVRPHYFANTAALLSKSMLKQMRAQITAIESAVRLPAYLKAVEKRTGTIDSPPQQVVTKGAFMGYDFHITEAGPRLIEINSNAGGAFIVDIIERAAGTSARDFASKIAAMFQDEWRLSGKNGPLKTIAIVDTDPAAQYHYPDMCLAKSLLSGQGFETIITDPKELRLNGGALYFGDLKIDVVYNRLTDFALTDPANAVISRAYLEAAAAVTPAPHHHARYADKRNLIWLSDPQIMKQFGANPAQLKALSHIPKTKAVTPDNADDMWARRRSLFFKPDAGFGSRGAFRGAKITKKVWADIVGGGYIAQEMIAPPMRAVMVDGGKTALKFDVRVYTYDGLPLLMAARIYQGQTTNLRTAGGGLAAVVPLGGDGCGG